MPIHWAFYFQGPWVPVSCCGTWSCSTCRVHITLYELQAVALMLHKMIFWLSGEVVTLHLDNGTAKAYLCNQGGIASLFSFHTRLLHFESGQQAWYYSYSSIHTYPSQCGNQLSLVGWLVQDWHFLALLRLHFTFGANQRWICCVLSYQSRSAILHLAKSTTPRSFGVEQFQPSLGILHEICVPSFCI